MPALISTAPGLAVHQFRELVIPAKVLEPQDFIGKIAYEPNKIFWFKKLVSAGNNIVDDFILETSNGWVKAYGTQQGVEVTFYGPTRNGYVKYYQEKIDRMQQEKRAGLAFDIEQVDADSHTSLINAIRKGEIEQALLF